MQEAKEEVRSRLNIEDVVSEYVQLKRAGRNFKGLSPFTSEKTPSFVVSPDKHIWHDFSSGKGGDIFGFIMEVEGLDFRGALELLARRANVDLSLYDSKQAGEITKKKRRLLEANELAAKYFQQSLLKNKHALEYTLKTRGIDKPTLEQFRIGYAPDSGDGLVRLLEKRQFTRQEIAAAGLTNRFGGDLFRGRMMVPLMDAGGQVIGFTGRILIDDSKAPKYLNTPQTLLYDKSRHVFGLSQAKEAIRKNDYSVVVEGNMDVISSHQAGVTTTVATAGTALTEQHLKILSRLSAKVRLAFDADQAGVAASERAIPIAETVGVELSMINLPNAVKDPDELIKKDPALWSGAIEEAEPVIDWLLRQYSQREDMSSARGKRQFTTAALAVVRTLSDSVEAEHYLNKIAEATDTSLETIRRKLADDTGKDDEKPSRLKPIKTSNRPVEIESPYQDALLAILLSQPQTRQLLASFDTGLFSGENRQKLANYFKKHPEAKEVNLLNLPEMDTYVKIVTLLAEERYAAWIEKDLTLEAARLLRRIEVEHKKQTKQTLIIKLRSAEDAGDDEAARDLREQLAALIKENV